MKATPRGGLVAALAGVFAAAGRAQSPNVVLLVVDDLDWADNDLPYANAFAQQRGDTDAFFEMLHRNALAATVLCSRRRIRPAARPAHPAGWSWIDGVVLSAGGVANPGDSNGDQPLLQFPDGQDSNAAMGRAQLLYFRSDNDVDDIGPAHLGEQLAVQLLRGDQGGNVLFDNVRVYASLTGGFDGKGSCPKAT